ncbi:hypothetical protein HZA57_02495, partial [Candidatus Poribacteria bacterium]|nr:hypothetical protein [Candidatus Poribacteria bacterium]
GEWLRPVLEGTDATVLLVSQNVIAYYGHFPVCIELNGLTDEFIAHREIPAAERGSLRTGHLKYPTREYLLARGTDLSLFTRMSWCKEYQQGAFLLPGGKRIRFWFITYDRDLVAEIRRRCGTGVVFTDFEDYLDQYLAARLPAVPREQLMRDYTEFSDYYFRHNDDPGREGVFQAALSEGVSP